MHKKTSQTTQKPEFRQILSQRSATFQTGALNILGQISHTLRKTHFFLFLSQRSKERLATSTHTYTHSKYCGGAENSRTSTLALKQHRHTSTTHLDRPIARRRKKEPNLSFRSFCATFPKIKRRKTLAVHASWPCCEDGMESVGTHGPFPVAASSTILARTHSRTNATVNVWRNERYRGATWEQRQRSEVA